MYEIESNSWTSLPHALRTSEHTWAAELYTKLIYALFADWHALLIMQSSIHCAIRVVYIFYIFFLNKNFFCSVFILFLSWVFCIVIVAVCCLFEIPDCYLWTLFIRRILVYTSLICNSIVCCSVFEQQIKVLFNSYTYVNLWFSTTRTFLIIES